jgi:Flp pilus assembly protein TadG
MSQNPHSLPMLKNFLRKRDGVSTIEFALVVPVLLLIIAGIVDIGGALKAKFDLNASLSAASNFVLLNADNVTAAKGGDLATKVAAITGGGLSSGHGVVSVSVNGGPGVTVTDGASQAQSGGGNADKCYCPSRSGSTISFGAEAACGTQCSGGGTAGKFVVIHASKPHNPLFGGFGVIDAGNVNVMAVVQPK